MDQPPHTLSFYIWLVKTESDFIVKSVETDLGRWMLVVAVISFDVSYFLFFSYLTFHLDDTRIGVFWLHFVAQYWKTEDWAWT